MGGPENGNFSLLYLVKMSLRRWVGSSKKPQNPLRNIKMAPYSIHSMIVCTTNKVMHHFIVDKKELPLISIVAVA